MEYLRCCPVEKEVRQTLVDVIGINDTSYDGRILGIMELEWPGGMVAYAIANTDEIECRFGNCYDKFGEYCCVLIEEEDIFFNSYIYCSTSVNRYTYQKVQGLICYLYYDRLSEMYHGVIKRDKMYYPFDSEVGIHENEVYESFIVEEESPHIIWISEINPEKNIYQMKIGDKLFKGRGWNEMVQHNGIICKHIFPKNTLFPFLLLEEETIHAGSEECLLVDPFGKVIQSNVECIIPNEANEMIMQLTDKTKHIVCCRDLSIISIISFPDCVAVTDIECCGVIEGQAIYQIKTCYQGEDKFFLTTSKLLYGKFEETLKEQFLNNLGFDAPFSLCFNVGIFSTKIKDKTVWVSSKPRLNHIVDTFITRYYDRVQEFFVSSQKYYALISDCKESVWLLPE